jgi:mono/diheme cytochrome c family protein
VTDGLLQSPPGIASTSRMAGHLVLIAWLTCLSCQAFAADGDDSRVLRFVRDGDVIGQTDLRTLRAHCGVERVRVNDPYYGAPKEFLACPLAAILRDGFGETAETLAVRDFFLHALDGYVKPASGAQLTTAGGYLAFADAELSDSSADPFQPAWQPIDRRQVDPGPYYLVWTNVPADEAEQWPWPYQLARIEIASVERQYPRTVPTGVPSGSPAALGYALFGKQCISCHAMNGQGGRVGPDLNVPRSIVEYRPRDQIMAFIRNPESFRYTSMPAHLHLSDAQLAAIVAYFDVMQHQKYDPGSAALTRVDGAGAEE